MCTLTHGLMHVVCEKFTIERVVRQGQQPGPLLVERLAHPQRAALRAGPVGGLAEAPDLGFSHAKRSRSGGSPLNIKKRAGAE